MERLATRFDEPADKSQEERAPPQVFVRTFSTPAGLPWDQTRAAQLDARHGAPLPIADLAHRIKRLTPWAPAQPGRFAVFYVRLGDFTPPFETTVDVDGTPIRVAFGTAAPDLGRIRAGGVVVLLAAACALAVTVAVGTSLSARAAAEQKLSVLEQRASAKLRMARRVAAARDRSRDLAAVRGRGGLAGDVLADLAGIQRDRTADARIVALHWERGLIAIESRGADAPLQSLGRSVVRSERPLRPGVWLWGVTSTAAAGESER